jgi:hypothetical protein
MAVGVLGNRGVDVLARVHGPAELAAEGLGQERLGDADALRGGQRRGALDGLAALSDAVGVADVRRPETALQGSAAREWCGLERWPWGEHSAAAGRVFVVNPVQDMRTGVFEGARETLREAHVVAHEAAALCDEWCEGAHRRALGFQRRELIAMCASECELELSVGGLGRGMAGCDGCTGSCERQGRDGKAHADGILSPRRDEGACVAFKTAGHRWSLEARAQGPHPRIEGVWRVDKDTARACLSASRVQADSVLGISPVAADAGRNCSRRETGQVSPPEGEARACGRHRRTYVRRRHDREPVARQPLRRR